MDVLDARLHRNILEVLLPPHSINYSILICGCALSKPRVIIFYQLYIHSLCTHTSSEHFIHYESTYDAVGGLDKGTGTPDDGCAAF